MEQAKRRCRWVNVKNPLSVKYHDHEWGIPHYDDKDLFEFLILESFQAGLSWECVLNKREILREAFDGFDYDQISRYDEEKINALCSYPN
ncbi:DNA-3-methyladenine glycosylase I, partial [Massilicoli timonensis]